jgi:hypothetical protein
MARALASIINILDPDVIVLGGGMSNIDRLYTNVPRLWGRFVFAAEADLQDRDESRIGPPESRLVTRLVSARHGATSGVRGGGVAVARRGDRGSGKIDASTHIAILGISVVFFIVIWNRLVSRVPGYITALALGTWQRADRRGVMQAQLDRASRTARHLSEASTLTSQIKDIHLSPFCVCET